jgi:hypothetical protein
MLGGKPLPERGNLDRRAGPAAETVTNALNPVPRYLSTRAGKIVPDAKWPNMYRIKWRDGRLSDMVNYTRASAALRGLM